MRTLIEIRGVGPAFCEKHGESLLGAIRELAPDAPRERQPSSATGTAHALPSNL
jgi:hypothetical protein